MQRDRKIKANRANARVSTGPKTARCRARSARNAFRHGLSVPVESDQVLCEQVQALTRQIAGSDTSVHTQILAHRIAEAQVDLLGVRHARHRLLSEELSNPDYLSPTIMLKQFRAVLHFAQDFGADRPLPADLLEFVESKPEALSKWQLFYRRTLVSSKRLTALSGAPFRVGSLQFERSMQSAVARYRTHWPNRHNRE
jgi:hypothetical protein